jgi:hypothetical protein
MVDKPKEPKTTQDLHDEFQASIETFLNERQVEPNFFVRSDLYLVIAELQFQIHWLMDKIIEQTKAAEKEAEKKDHEPN